jgi:hypothetical protein
MLADVSVSSPQLSTLLLGELDIFLLLRAIQAKQAGGNSLCMGRRDRRCRKDGKESG